MGNASYVGIGAALGTSAGTVIFAISGAAFWIAIGAGIGVTLGTAWSGERR